MSAYLAHINIMTREDLEEPNGMAAVEKAKSLGLKGVAEIRIGKHLTIKIFAKTMNEAHRMTEKACEQMLLDTERETYDFVVEEIA